MEMTVKEKLDMAVGAAWAAFMAKLGELGVGFDDCDGGTFVDDPVERKTWCFSANVVECDEYGGEE